MRALRDFLLAPPGVASLDLDPPAAGGRLGRRAPAAVRSAAGVPGAVAVLCAAEDARAVGVAAAALVARRARAACGLACVWTGAEAPRRPEMRASSGRAVRRLAVALVGRGLVADPCGRAVVVTLDGDPAVALAEAGRAAAAAGDAPAVLVLGEPRPAAFDTLLAEQDRLLVLTRPGADAAMATLALAGLPDGAVAEALAHPLAFGAATRALAAAGYAVPGALRRALDAAPGTGR
jgi:hypothetical protein